MSIFLSENTSKTKKIGEFLAREILETGPQRKKAFILGLIGDLGGGKTTFLQGFARGLGIKEKILSPTFVIIKRFKIPRRKTLGFLWGKQDLRFKNFYHFDCYRIQKPKEILELGWKEIVNNPGNIIAIEWADRVFKILPKDILILKFDFINDKTRKISLKINPVRN